MCCFKAANGLYGAIVFNNYNVVRFLLLLQGKRFEQSL